MEYRDYSICAWLVSERRLPRESVEQETESAGSIAHRRTVICLILRPKVSPGGAIFGSVLSTNIDNYGVLTKTLNLTPPEPMRDSGQGSLEIFAYLWSTSLI